LSPWRGNGNRRRNDDWDGSNQKRWRRDDPEWDEQQKPWKRGPINEEEEWQNNQQGLQWTAGQNDNGNFSKFKNRDNNEDRPRKPSKWSDKESDDKDNEDHWNKKSVEQTSKDESNTEEGPHQTSAPMDLDNYEVESVDNIEQLHGTQEKEIVNSNKEFKHKEFENEQIEENVHHDNFNTKSHDHDVDIVKKSLDDPHNNKHQQFEEYQNYDSNNLHELSHVNIEEVTQNMESQFEGNFKQHNVEDKQHTEYHSHNDFPKDDSHNNYNSQNEFEKIQNNNKFEQNQTVEPKYSNSAYEDKLQNYDQSYNDEVSLTANQAECLVDNFISQANESNNDTNVDEKSSNFYFGVDCGSSLSKSIEQSHEVIQNEETVSVILSDNCEEVHDINMTEPN